MRVIGGDAKGRRILFPKRSSARPTSDRTRETLFNILSSLEDKVFLDVYAGSGSVGIEALSRGASFAFFIERDAILSGFINNNLLQCGFAGRYKLLNCEAKKALALLKAKQGVFDIIFADPPYDQGFVQETLDHFSEGTMFRDDGLLIIQHSIREDIPLAMTGYFRIFDQRKFGDTYLSFLKIHETKGTL